MLLIVYTTCFSGCLSRKSFCWRINFFILAFGVWVCVCLWNKGKEEASALMTEDKGTKQDSRFNVAHATNNASTPFALFVEPLQDNGCGSSLFFSHSCPWESKGKYMKEWDWKFFVLSWVKIGFGIGPFQCKCSFFPLFIFLITWAIQAFRLSLILVNIYKLYHPRAWGKDPSGEGHVGPSYFEREVSWFEYKADLIQIKRLIARSFEYSPSFLLFLNGMICCSWNEMTWSKSQENPMICQHSKILNYSPNLAPWGKQEI